MNRLSDGKYAARLRVDYLSRLQEIRREADRDICIQNAILEYLALPDEVRDRETESQKLEFMRWSGAPAPDHPPIVDQILIPDALVARLQPCDIYGDLDINLNAAIRLWLQARDLEGLEP